MAKDVATRTAHPRWLLDRWTRMFGADRAAAIAEANQQLSYPDVFAENPPSEAVPSKLVPGMFKLSGSSANIEGYALDEGSGVIADLASAELKQLVRKLREENAEQKRVLAELREEIARLKGLKGRPRIKLAGL